MPGPATAKAKIPAAKSPFVTKAVGSAAFTIGTISTRTIKVSVQLKDQNGAALAQRASLFGYLSDDSHGDSVVAAAPSTATAGSTNGILIPMTTKSFMVTSESNGTIDIALTEAGAATRYVVLVMPDGTLNVSSVVTFT